MSQVWFCSDLHIGHRTVAALRGMRSAAEHDAALAANWDALVRPDDVVWVLGDISVGGKGPEMAALQWIQQRPGTKHLVSGNHDGCHVMRSRAHIWQRIYLDNGFSSVQSDATRKIAEHRVLLSHFPYAGDPAGDHTPENRFEEWRRPDTGQVLLHGHTHSPIQQRGRQLHVGLDAHHLQPVPLDWVEDRIHVMNLDPRPTALTAN